jgi:anti-sigma factor RsiW
VNATALRCRELVELVTDYLEDALPAAERARFDAHIADCEHCTAYLEQMRTTIVLTGRLRAEELAPESVEPLLEAFRDWRRKGG